MQVHLVDGTYELFRHHFAVPSHHDPEGMEVAATRGVVGSILMMLEGGATHLGVATDHVVESFRNDLYLPYKTSAGMEPELLAQFPLIEDVLRALGVAVWAMVEVEADDALASAAAVGAADPRVERVIICTPDKDLSQCVVGDRVVQLDRRSTTIRDEAGVVDKFGVLPESIPDWLALVGDSADGFPGLPGWGAKSAATVLARYVHLEDIPDAREGLGRRRAQRGQAGDDARGPARGRGPVQGAGDAARRRRRRHRRRMEVDRAGRHVRRLVQPPRGRRDRAPGAPAGRVEEMTWQ